MLFMGNICDIDDTDVKSVSSAQGIVGGLNLELLSLSGTAGIAGTYRIAIRKGR